MRLLAQSLIAALLIATGTGAYATPGATFGDWSLGSTADGQLYAGTTNDSGGMLIKGCDPSKAACYWYLITYTACDVGALSPALINSTLGTATVNLQCDGGADLQGGRMYRYQVGNPDLLDSVATGSSNVGIAVGLVDGQFKVYRFSLKGASTAISTLLKGALSTPTLNRKPRPSSTRDTTL